ncbi:unnamed protein product [Lactuca virosa]|uniref:Uncharacterized protein n=1 Tax=Lactuca virosa TaxID=75947 RepID=A0AAU9M535_9ASTR|nr:unnamed protein product [Lactuca virosa]
MDAKLSYSIPQINNIMDAKTNLILNKINQHANVTSSGATSQQGGDGAEKEPEHLNTGGGLENVENPINNKIPILKFVIINPYHTKNVGKVNATKVHLEKQSLEEKLKDLKEKSFIDQKINVSYGSGKGKVTVIS